MAKKFKSWRLIVAVLLLIAGLTTFVVGANLEMQNPRTNEQGDFAWQEGYAAFTVSPTARNVVKEYIAGQAEHHRTKPFREELVELLHLAEIEFDERFLD